MLATRWLLCSCAFDSAMGVYPWSLLWKALPLFAVCLLPTCHLAFWFLGRTSIQVSSLCNLYSPLREQCDRSHGEVTCGRLPFAHNHLLIACIFLAPIHHLNIAYQWVNISKHNFQKLPKKTKQKQMTPIPGRFKIHFKPKANNYFETEIKSQGTYHLFSKWARPLKECEYHL